MKRIYLVFIIFIFYSFVFCQTNQWQSWQYDKNILSIAAQGRYVWLGSNIKGLVRMDTITHEKTFYNTSNSPLPSNCVSFIKIDYNGNIWTNAGGLTCFDGINWTIFNHNNANLPECNIVEFDFDHSGNIWAATNIGLVKFDGVTSTVYDSSNSGLPYDSYYQNRKNCVSVDSSGKVWVSNVSAFDWSITSYYNGLWQTYNMTQLGLNDNGMPVYCLETDIYDTLWIGTGYGGLIHKVGDEIFIYNNSNSGIPGNWVSCIDFDLDGNIWMGSWNDFINCGGVAKFDGNNWQTWITGYGGTWVDFYQLNCIETQAERVWVGTQRGYDEYDGIHWYHNSLSDNGLTNYWIEPVVVDQNNRVWFGCQGSTVGQGLIMFDGNYWSYFDCVVSDLCVDHYNRVWVLDRAWVKRFDLTNGSVTNVGLPSEYSPNSPNHFTGMAFESDDSFWLATTFFIAKLPPGGLWTVYTSENSGLLVDPQLGAPIIIGIYIDSHDNKWIFNAHQGLIMFNGYDWIYYNESTTGLQIIRIESVLVDQEDNLWIAEGYFDHHHILYKFDGTNWTVYDANNSLIPAGSNLNCLKMDTQGKIWLGTSEGLCIIDGDNWQLFTTANSGLPNNNVESIAFDSFGNAWLGTHDGLAVYYTNTSNNDDYIPNHFDAKFLLSNYPNPFNPETNISFILPTAGYVKLNIYNIKGQKVISLFQGNLAEGKHNFSFNIADSNENIISSGVYFIKLEFENDIQIHKMLLIK